MFHLDRIGRLKRDIEPYRRHILAKAPKKAQARMRHEFKRLEQIKKRIRIFQALRIVCYVFVYVSVVSAIFSDLWIIGTAVTLLQMITGVFGVTLLLGIIAICNRIINMYVSDAHIVADVIVSTAVLHGA